WAPPGGRACPPLEPNDRMCRGVSFVTTGHRPVRREARFIAKKPAILDTILGHLAAGHARLTTRRFLRAAAYATQSQDALLRAFLSAGARSEFSRHFGLDR